jgi:hypothetical protein
LTSLLAIHWGHSNSVGLSLSAAGEASTSDRSNRVGTTLFNLLNLLRSYRNTYPSVKIAWDKQVRVVVDNAATASKTDARCSSQAPSTSPIHLILSSPPLLLLFDPVSQRLSRIEVSANPGSWVAYRGKTLREGAGEDEEDVLKMVRRVVGPTYNSARDSGEGEEVLSYPGVAFCVARQADGRTFPGWRWRSVWLTCFRCQEHPFPELSSRRFPHQPISLSTRPGFIPRCPPRLLLRKEIFAW